MIPKHMHLIFDHLVEAALDGSLCLMESRDRQSGLPRYVLASVDKEGSEYLICPFGHLSETPFEDYEDPITVEP